MFVNMGTVLLIYFTSSSEVSLISDTINLEGLKLDSSESVPRHLACCCHGA